MMVLVVGLRLVPDFWDVFFGSGLRFLGVYQVWFWLQYFEFFWFDSFWRFEVCMFAEFSLGLSTVFFFY